MTEIMTFIRSDLGTFIGYLFGVIGVVSAYYTFRSYRDGIKQNKRYSTLFEAADKKIDKEIIEKEIMLSKKEKEEITKEISLMKQDISAVIPDAAKKAALSSKLDEQIELLLDQYNSVCETRSKLEKLSNSQNFLSEIEEIVKGETTPSYYQNKERETAKEKLFLIVLLVLLINQFVSSPMSNIIALVGITLILPDLKTWFNLSKVSFSSLINVAITRVLTIVSIICNLFICVYLLFYNEQNKFLKIFDVKVNAGKAILITSILSFLVMYIMIFRIAYKKETPKFLFKYVPLILMSICLFFFGVFMSCDSVVVLSSVSDSKIFYYIFVFIMTIVLILILTPKFIEIINGLKNKNR